MCSRCAAVPACIATDAGRIRATGAEAFPERETAPGRPSRVATMRGMTQVCQITQSKGWREERRGRRRTGEGADFPCRGGARLPGRGRAAPRRRSDRPGNGIAQLRGEGGSPVVSKPPLSRLSVEALGAFPRREARRAAAARDAPELRGARSNEANPCGQLDFRARPSRAMSLPPRNRLPFEQEGASRIRKNRDRFVFFEK